MSIRFRDFAEVEPNIFINSNYSYVTVNDDGELVGKVDIPSIVNEARSRVAAFFGGELQSDSVFIFSDNDKTINKTGDRHAYSFTLYNYYSYIAISYRNINVDIIAHEITHAELHYRLMNGRMFQFNVSVPTWFNEGLASINDYRNIMNEEALKKRLENGADIIDVTKLTKADFRKTHVNDAMFNALIIRDYYLLSRHEVNSWIEKNGVDALLWLIDGIRSGRDFHELYYGR
jgi:hypothetical protein